VIASPALRQKIGRLSKRTENRILLGLFFGFLLFISVENQLSMFREIKAFRNDAFVFKLNQQVRKEFLAFKAGKPGALDVTAGNDQTRLSQIVERLGTPLPDGLVLEDGPAGQGRLLGLGHPYIGGRPEWTEWRLTAGRPGGSLEFDILPAQGEPQ
jgi:hypothetical protein